MANVMAIDTMARGVFWATTAGMVRGLSHPGDPTQNTTTRAMVMSARNQTSR
jgi:hypothetical protein